MPLNYNKHMLEKNSIKEDQRIIDLIEKLKKEPNPFSERIRKTISKLILPRSGKILIKIIEWDQVVSTDSGLELVTDYAPDKSELREGNRPMNETMQGIIIETSSLAEQEGYLPGMKVLVIRPEQSGYSTKVNIPSVDGLEIHELYILHYGEVLAIIAEERIEKKIDISVLPSSKN